MLGVGALAAREERKGSETRSRLRRQEQGVTTLTSQRARCCPEVAPAARSPLWARWLKGLPCSTSVPLEPSLK